jgi:hypothetical protein
MLLTELTIYDLRLLERLRIERFRRLFAESLSEWTMEIDRGIALVYCKHPKLANRLLVEIVELGASTWQILGVSSIAIYCGHQALTQLQYTCPNGEMG